MRIARRRNKKQVRRDGVSYLTFIVCPEFFWDNFIILYKIVIARGAKVKIEIATLVVVVRCTR